MPQVRVTGWSPGFNKVGCTTAVRRAVGINLGEAKAFTDTIVSGKIAVLDVPDKQSAEQLALELKQIGAIVEWHEQHD